MVRHLLVILALAFALPVLANDANLAASATSSAEAPMCVPNGDTEVQGGGDLVPWPWGNEVKFPWTHIQGVWAPVSPDCNSYFAFKVSKATETGERFIQVTQYDPHTCQKVATGVGYENARVIYASMTSGSASFDLTIRAFDTSVLKGELMCQTRDGAQIADPIPTPGTSVLVVTLYPKQNWDLRSSYQLTKLQAVPSLLCD